MLDLDNHIARLELRAEQMAIHLRELGRNTPYAPSARSELYAILQQLGVLKSERQRRNAMLERERLSNETPNLSPTKPQSAARLRGTRVP
jgi:hypothetical protein